MTTNVTTVSFAQGTAPVGDTAVFEIYIKATPERIWEAITDPTLRAKFSFGVQTESDWATGSTYRAGVPGVVAIAEGARDHAGHMGDRARRRLMPANGRARPASGQRERRALRRLADDPLRTQDAPGDRRIAHHSGLAHVQPGLNDKPDRGISGWPGIPWWVWTIVVATTVATTRTCTTAKSNRSPLLRTEESYSAAHGAAGCIWIRVTGSLSPATSTRPTPRAGSDTRRDRDEDDHQHLGAIAWSGGGAGTPTACSRSRPLSRDRTRCPRCPASRGTTRSPHRQAVAARVPRRAPSVVRIRPQVRPGALPPQVRCRPARQDAADS